MEGQPTLLKLTPKLGLSVEQGMDLLCAAGMALSFLCVVCGAMRDTVSFILLWMLYFSLYQVQATLTWPRSHGFCLILSVLQSNFNCQNVFLKFSMHFLSAFLH